MSSYHIAICYNKKLRGYLAVYTLDGFRALLTVMGVLSSIKVIPFSLVRYSVVLVVTHHFHLTHWR